METISKGLKHEFTENSTAFNSYFDLIEILPLYTRTKSDQTYICKD